MTLLYYLKRNTGNSRPAGRIRPAVRFNPVFRDARRVATARCKICYTYIKARARFSNGRTLISTVGAGDTTMKTVLVLSALCVCVRASGVLHAGPAPVVTAASSQYFQRTFNRLVAAPVLETPIVVAEAPVVPETAIVPVAAAAPINPSGTAQPADPNVAIAIATAHAARPINTFIFPSFPVAPSTVNFLPIPPTNETPKDKPREEVTPRTPRVTTLRTTAAPPPPQPEFNQASASSSSNNDFQPAPSASSSTDNAVLPISSSSNHNNNFNRYPPPVQRPFPTDNIVNRPYPPKNDILPVPAFSSQNNNFNQYGPPVHRPLPSNNNFNIRPQIPHTYSHPQKFQTPSGHSQKLKTTVEIVRAPLAYIAPPPLHHHHIKHIHTFVPAKVVVRPITYTSLSPARLRSRVAVGRTSPAQARSFNVVSPQIPLRNPLIPRDIEPTTFSPFRRSNTKPPKI
ncbi:hypothetical protein EVAR_28324_1 [Eumeta japonica]|uniref:Uncharacterized protein n=1 Tax=Eumeta variegata TaxID=151549 RepID=A0A4C1VBZ0_EUMVA|nr:hypothetical protein EVAR_28324_1 [Eumeta japonica]